jgi:hypothetical protein
MKQILLIFRSLFSRLGLLSTPQPQQLDFLATLESPAHPQGREPLRSLSK